MNIINKITKKCNRILKPFFTFEKSKKLETIFNEIELEKYNTVIVFENSFGWDGIMKQRPQQIALNFDENILFLYHSNKDNYETQENYKKIKDNLYMINLDIYRGLISTQLKDVPNKHMMMYSTNYINNKIINKYLNNDFKLIYEYIDDIDEELSGKRTSKKLIKNYNYVVNMNKSYIVCTATKLYDNVIRDSSNAKVKLITNGCDYDHFKKKNHIMPNDIKKIKKSGKPIVGYYGALASWFDYELIKKISNTNKYEIVLIGIKYDDTLDKSGLLELDNIHYLGKIDYDDLPSYSSYFDISTIPFMINEITLSTSPVKIFEYMASEKPIVTTDLPECRKYKSVLIGKNQDEFIENLDSALKMSKDKDYIGLLKNEALSNTWDSKCKDLIKFISGGVS